MTKNKRAVALLSGGLNSFVATKLAMTMRYEIIEAITFNYGQEHCDEVDAAMELAKYLEVPISVYQPTMMWEYSDGLALDVAKHMTQVGLNNSFWYGRELVIPLVAAARAHALKCAVVITGTTAPRVGRKAIELQEAAIDAAGFKVTFEHPFIETKLGHAFKEAEALGIWDQALTMNYDCLHGSQAQNSWGIGCGQCEGCLRRMKAHETIVEFFKEELQGGQHAQN